MSLVTEGIAICGVPEPPVPSPPPNKPDENRSSKPTPIIIGPKKPPRDYDESTVGGDADDAPSHISTYTMQTLPSRIDDGTAQIPRVFSYGRSITFKVKTKRRRRFPCLCFCCKGATAKSKQQHAAALKAQGSRGSTRGGSVDTNDDVSLLRSGCVAENEVVVTTSVSQSELNTEEIMLKTETEDFLWETVDQVFKVAVRETKQARRTRIPGRPDVPASLWSLIKNAIGKDLTKLPLPVNFNEPLSMLQRLTEDYEYSHLLDKAVASDQPAEQLAYVAAFTISGYASSVSRIGKPFNPLLGETYECDRSEDLGWRCLSEQVCHHPPIVAQHCQGRHWVCWQQFSMGSKFRGNSIEIQPVGLSHLMCTKTGSKFTWVKTSTVVHNVMIGKLWIDQEGEVMVYNNSTGHTCRITYYPTTSYFRGDAKHVDATVYDSQKQAKIYINGYWDSKLEMFDILSVDNSGKMTLGPGKLIWNKNPTIPDSDKMYYFTLLACQLNEMEEGIAPSDSRNRPDQRLMENGFFDEANAEKLRLEEKQRISRKERSAFVNSISGPNPSLSTIDTRMSSGYIKPIHPEQLGDTPEPGYSPRWFTLTKDKIIGKGKIYSYNGDYWECKVKQDWSRCPDIF